MEILCVEDGTNGNGAVEDGTNGNAAVEDALEGCVHSDGCSVILDEYDPELILIKII